MPHHLSADGAVNSSQPGAIPPVGYNAGAYAGQKQDIVQINYLNFSNKSYNYDFRLSSEAIPCQFITTPLLYNAKIW